MRKSNLQSKETPNIEFDDDKELGYLKAEFLEQINRGGLCTPSDSMYICVLYARQLFKTLTRETLKRIFFQQVSKEMFLYLVCNSK